MTRVANAPCSWGVLEFESTITAASPSQMLDEMAAAGYSGTELGDWGFLPTDPAALAATLQPRSLDLAGAFVPVALTRATALDDGIARAVRTARLLSAASVSAAIPPMLVLSDENGTVADRTARAGRMADADMLPAGEWDGFAERVDRIAAAVKREAGLRTAFHHHCAGYVETAGELEALMSRTDPSTVGICLDTGHLTYAGGDPVETIERYGNRIWHVHFKDCDPEVARAARTEGLDYFAAVRRGIFCELGRGAVRFVGVRDALHRIGYSGWIVVEQDVLPSMGTPAESARRNREYLRSLGL